MTDATHAGGCLCSGVRYVVNGPMRDVVACHCSQCRRTTGHHVAASHVPSKNLEFVTAETLAWYQSSSQAERGFCRRCGSSLFWRQTSGDSGTSIMAGTLDGPTQLKLVKHIFTADKSDYYQIADGAPQFEQWPTHEAQSS